jgi:ribosome-binding factor A
MQYRRHKIAEQLRTEISAIFARELRDDLPGLVTVTTVEITPDLRRARVLISLFGSAEQKSVALATLEKSAAFIRRLLGTRMRLRHTPELTFVEDHSIEEGDRMVTLIEAIEQKPPED